MFGVTVREHIMIAHSLPDPAFGPAQGMHGATYVVDAEFRAPALNDKNVVIDIAIAHEALRAILGPLNYQNLDDFPQMQGKLTTTEYLAKHIHDKLSQAIASDFQGELKITLHESHVASASYSAPVAP
jgi:6-pyruvoyltetrahydropterin/6-carboxytetrahydropterin synthase